MNYKIDHCEPFDGKSENFWMKCEHIGRYIFATDFLTNAGCKKILDVACAEGFGSYLLSKRGLEVLGADINSDYIRTATSRCNARFFVLDFENDTFPKEMHEADGIVCFETIEHLRNGNNFLEKLSECLKPGGYILLSFPSDRYEKIDENGINYDPYHLRIYSETEMRTMLRKLGLELIDEYGQSLSNLLYSAESDAISRGAIESDATDKLFRYDERSLITMSSVLGYPDKRYLEDTYSHIYVLRKA